MKNVDYCFTSQWLIEAEYRRAARAVEDVERWNEWWRGLEKLEILQSRRDHVGSMILGQWRTSGYRLEIIIEITEHVPEKLLRFKASEDLVGEGSWIIRSKNEHQTEMQITWNVATTKAWMNLLAPILQPVFKWNHHRVMKRGEQGLNEYLKR